MEHVVVSHGVEKMKKRALQAPSTITILIGALVILAIIVILVLFFKQNIGESGIFNYATDWKGLQWG